MKVPVIAIAYSAIAEKSQNCDWVPKNFEQAGLWACYFDNGPNFIGDYRDPIHPSVLGNQRLARFVASEVRRRLQSNRPKVVVGQEMQHSRVQISAKSSGASTER